MSNDLLLKYKDFVILGNLAKDEFLDISAHASFKGMKRDLTMEEKRILSFYAATVCILNKKGVIKEGIELHKLFDLEELRG